MSKQQGKTHHVIIKNKVKVRGSLGLIQKRQGWPKFLRKFINRRKLSRRGKEAREILEIDRSDKEKTVKRHKVWELNNDKWELVHDEHEEYPAKRRPDEQGPK